MQRFEHRFKAMGGPARLLLDCPDDTAALAAIDAAEAEIDRLEKQSIDQAHEMAIAVLKLNRELLDAMAEALLKEDVLEGEHLQDMLEKAQAHVNTQIWLATGKTA